jgi:hypothetical protein
MATPWNSEWSTGRSSRRCSRYPSAGRSITSPSRQSWASSTEMMSERYGFSARAPSYVPRHVFRRTLPDFSSGHTTSNTRCH